MRNRPRGVESVLLRAKRLDSEVRTWRSALPNRTGPAMHRRWSWDLLCWYVRPDAAADYAADATDAQAYAADAAPDSGTDVQL